MTVSESKLQLYRLYLEKAKYPQVLFVLMEVKDMLPLTHIC